MFYILLCTIKIQITVTISLLYKKRIFTLSLWKSYFPNSTKVSLLQLPRCVLMCATPGDTQRVGSCRGCLCLGKQKTANSEELKPFEDRMFCQLGQTWTLGEIGSSSGDNHIQINYSTKLSLACLPCYLKQTRELNKILCLSCSAISLCI